MTTSPFRAAARTLLPWLSLNLLLSWTRPIWQPEGLPGYLLATWLPALTALGFLRLQGSPVREALGLRVGRISGYAWAVLLPVSMGVIAAGPGLYTGWLRLSPGWYGRLHGELVRSVLFVLTLGHDVGITYRLRPPPGLAVELFIGGMTALAIELAWRGYMRSQMGAFRHAPAAIGLSLILWNMATNRWALAQLPWLMIGLPLVLLSYPLVWLYDRAGSVLPCALFSVVFGLVERNVRTPDDPGALQILRISRPYGSDPSDLIWLIAVGVVCTPFVARWYRQDAVTVPPATARCPVCTGAVGADDVPCPGCMTPIHRDCSRLSRHCPVCGIVAASPHPGPDQPE